FTCRKILRGVMTQRGDNRIEQRRSEEHTSELQSLTNLVCRLLLEKKKKKSNRQTRIQNDRSVETRRMNSYRYNNEPTQVANTTYIYTISLLSHSSLILNLFYTILRPRNHHHFFLLFFFFF